MANSDQGLTKKYIVHRTDGRCCRNQFVPEAPDPKHLDCEYFVLDLTHDPRARLAAYEYANMVNAFNPKLASDLFDQLARLGN